MAGDVSKFELGEDLLKQLRNLSLGSNRQIKCPTTELVDFNTKLDDNCEVNKDVFHIDSIILESYEKLILHTNNTTVKLEKNAKREHYDKLGIESKWDISSNDTIWLTSRAQTFDSALGNTDNCEKKDENEFEYDDGFDNLFPNFEEDEEKLSTLKEREPKRNKENRRTQRTSPLQQKCDNKAFEIVSRRLPRTASSQIIEDTSTVPSINIPQYNWESLFNNSNASAQEQLVASDSKRNNSKCINNVADSPDSGYAGSPSSSNSWPSSSHVPEDTRTSLRISNEKELSLPSFTKDDCSLEGMIPSIAEEGCIPRYNVDEILNDLLNTEISSDLCNSNIGDVIRNQFNDCPENPLSSTQPNSFENRSKYDPFRTCPSSGIESQPDVGEEIENIITNNQRCKGYGETTLLSTGSLQIENYLAEITDSASQSKFNQLSSSEKAIESKIDENIEFMRACNLKNGSFGETASCSTNSSMDENGLFGIFNCINDMSFQSWQTNKGSNDERKMKTVNSMTENAISTNTVSSARSTRRPSYKNISCEFKDEAKEALLNSDEFSLDEYIYEAENLIREIQQGLLATNERKVIHILSKAKKLKNLKTNLHDAIQMCNVERAYAIVELHKEYHKDMFEINSTDSDRKTALDYAEENQLHLLANYLKENRAKGSV